MLSTAMAGEATHPASGALAHGKPCAIWKSLPPFSSLWPRLSMSPRVSWTAALPRDYLGSPSPRLPRISGRMAARRSKADPGRFYDVGLYNEALRALAGSDYPGQTWSYPRA
jgi:hypothetical protein